jgi:phytoene synthase
MIQNPLAAFKVSSFAPAFLLLPPARRRALAAVYAFARAVDDAVDEIGIEGRDPSRARAALARWRAAFEGEPVSFEEGEARAWHGLRRAMERFQVPAAPLIELVAGVERDLDQTRYATFDDLKTYCHGVAGTVGLACLPIFGLAEETHRVFAEKLGLAVQLVNILRDVKADSLRDHIYLPAEDLARFGHGEEEIMALVFNDNFRRLMAFEGERARAIFAEARAALPPESRRAARPALAMGRIYEALLQKMAANNFNVFGDRPRLGFLEKLRALRG